MIDTQLFLDDSIFIKKADMEDTALIQCLNQKVKRCCCILF